MLARRRDLLLFAVVYLLYDASRWVFAGTLATAAAHARWVIDLERSMDVATERSAQRLFEWGVAEWLLSNVLRPERPRPPGRRAEKRTTAATSPSWSSNFGGCGLAMADDFSG